MKMRVDPLQIKAAEGLAGVSALLRILVEAVPEYEKRERTALRELAERQGFDFGEYDVARKILDSRFGFWLPRFAAYSVVTLVYAVLEPPALRVRKTSRETDEVAVRSGQQEARYRGPRHVLDGIRSVRRQRETG